MYALIIGIGICIVGLIYALATAKEEPNELDEFEQAIGGDIAHVDEVQCN